MHRVCGLAFAALLIAAVPAHAGVAVFIDKSSQRMTVSVDGRATYQWPVSTGRGRYDTPVGDFHAIRLERVYYSKKYDDAPMPNSVFFHGGYAIHGTYEERKLGRPASHGCVRLSRAHAATLFALVRAHGMHNTHITVGGSIHGFRGDGSYSSARRTPPRDTRPYRSTRTYDNWSGDLGRPYVARRVRPGVDDPYAPPPVVHYDRGFDSYYARPARRSGRRSYGDGVIVHDDGRGFRW